MVGGHIDKIEVSQDDPRILIKSTHNLEMEFYESVYDPKSEKSLQGIK